MNDYEELVNDYIKDYCETFWEKYKIVFDRLPIFSNLFLDLLQWLTDFVNNYYIDINWLKVSKADFAEKEKLINDFYKYLNLDFSMQNVLKDGSLDITTYSLEQGLENHDYFYCGKCGMSLNNHYVNVNNTGLITDAIIWVHEFAHYRNDFKYIRSEVNDLLTESISFAYELIFLDYLEQKGYTYEANAFLYSVFYTLFYHTYKSYSALQLISVYSQFGNINKENYNLLFNDDNYDIFLKEFKNTFIDKNKDIMFYTQYGLSNALSLYMFYEYKKDKSFLNKIEKFNNSLEDLELEECLSIIGIVNYNDYGLEDFQNLDKIENSIEYIKNKIMKSNLIKVRTKQKAL